MTQPKSFSNFFSSIAARLETSREDLRLIERERLLTPTERIIPLQYFSKAIANPSANPSTTPSHLQNKMLRALSRFEMSAIIGGMSSKHSMFLKEKDAVPQEVLDIADNVLQLIVHEDNHEQVEYSVVPFIYLGDAITLMDEQLRNDDFWLHTRIGLYKGEGSKDLQLWKRINALKDYTHLFDDTPMMRRPPRRKEQPQQKFGLVGKPSFI